LFIVRYNISSEVASPWRRSAQEIDDNMGVDDEAIEEMNKGG
jgi:hypothetical protein